MAKLIVSKLNEEEIINEIEATRKEILLASDKIIKTEKELSNAYYDDKPTKAIINRKNREKRICAELVYKMNELNKEYNARYRNVK